MVACVLLPIAHLAFLVVQSSLLESLSLSGKKEEMHELLTQVARSRGDDAKADPSLIAKLTAKVPADTREFVQLQLLKFLAQHSNHLPGFVLPAAATTTPV